MLGVPSVDWAVVAEDCCGAGLLGVDRSHGAVWDWMHKHSERQSGPPMAEPPRVAVDEKQIEIDGKEKWLYAAIITESKLLLEIGVYSRCGTDPAVVFLYRLTENHDVSDTEFLVDAAIPDRPLLTRLSGQLNYSETLHRKLDSDDLDADRSLHSCWRGSQSSAHRWLRQVRHHYNHDWPNKAVNGRTLAEVVLNYIVPYDRNIQKIWLQHNMCLRNCVYQGVSHNGKGSYIKSDFGSY